LVPVLLGMPILAAEVGRRRRGGRTAFPPSSALWAPLWTLERAVMIWVAMVQRLRGGTRYRGRRLPTAATHPIAVTPVIDNQRCPISRPSMTTAGSIR
jgi:hypothetical protein